MAQILISVKPSSLWPLHEGAIPCPLFISHIRLISYSSFTKRIKSVKSKPMFFTLRDVLYINIEREFQRVLCQEPKNLHFLTAPSPLFDIVSL